MFDIGFAELVIIGVVALLVIGPERLPGAIRTGSAWLNRIRRGFNDIKREVQQELHNDEIMRELRESRDQLQHETESLRQELSEPLDDTRELLGDDPLGIAGDAAAESETERKNPDNKPDE